jgi:hypothetical protein
MPWDLAISPPIVACGTRISRCVSSYLTAVPAAHRALR